ncbi:MAG TPA: DEAD/DEAH box helicase [Opitutaceae bacterium]|nr:DEAD/DEAH box helicase [Opitutaceae bacterium]
MEKRPFTELGLAPELLKAVDKMGFEEASPIQTAVIPVALTGRDVVGQSATGSGKTAAFAVPAITRVDSHLKAVQVLVLCPTRELAVQVAEEVGKLSLCKRGVHAVPIYGGQSYERQFRALAAGVQIVIGTPGRVMDHMERGTLKLDALKLVILDEADRMLDMGFRDDIEHILSRSPATRQSLFFSATMPRAIQELISRYSKDPAWIKIEAHAKNAPQVDQVYFEVDRRTKIDVLTRLIDLYDFRYGIIFCSTKIMVDELDEHLHARGYATDRLHGDISQAQRDRVMDKFRRRGFEFLVATDVAARGLDLDDLEVVFNFDLPNDAEDYTHRIGRTGRAGKTGKAFTFVSGRDLWKLQSMVRFAKLKIRRENVPSLDQVEEARANLFFEKLRTTLDQATYRKQDRLIDRLLEHGYASTDICSALIHLLQGGETAADPAPTPAAKPERKAHPPAAADAEARPISAVAPVGGADEPAPRAPRALEAPKARPAPREAYAPASRTGKDPGFTTVFLNVGRKNLVTPADVVGKIAGVTRLPAQIVGAIDIRQRHTLVDVLDEHAAFVLEKLKGIRVKGQALVPALATEKDAATE